MHFVSSHFLHFRPSSSIFFARFETKVCVKNRFRQHIHFLPHSRYIPFRFSSSFSAFVGKKCIFFRRRLFAFFPAFLVVNVVVAPLSQYVQGACVESMDALPSGKPFKVCIFWLENCSPKGTLSPFKRKRGKKRLHYTLQNRVSISDMPAHALFAQETKHKHLPYHTLVFTVTLLCLPPRRSSRRFSPLVDPRLLNQVGSRVFSIEVITLSSE